MISTKNINYSPITRDNILKFVSEEDIFRKYIPYEFEIGEVFSAPYREDKTPSFAVYWNSSVSRLMFKDHGRKLGGDCFKYVMDCAFSSKLTFWEACLEINKAFNLGLGGIKYAPKEIVAKNTVSARNKVYKKILVKSQPYTTTDLQYWGQYFITPETLKFYNVLSCYEYYVNNEFRRRYSDQYPIYAYYFPRTGNKKIYIPNEDRYNKWYTNANNDWDVMGYDQLSETGDLIYITKSMKDCMVLYELGFNSVATHGEGQYFNPDFIQHLRERFKRIVLFYDNDEAGIECSKNMCETYDLENFYLPVELYKNENIKDISDYIKVYGKEKAWIVIK